MDGYIDGTEYQNCLLIFFILFSYIDELYMYLLRNVVKKLPPTFLWVSSCDVKLGSWDLIFETHMGTRVFLF